MKEVIPHRSSFRRFVVAEEKQSNKKLVMQTQREILAVAQMMNDASRSAARHRSSTESGPGFIAMYETFGYKLNPRYDDFYHLYNREGVAKRIIDVIVDSTWNSLPLVTDNQIQDNRDIKVAYDPFEDACYKLFHQNKFLSNIKRTDKLASIGQYSILVIGTKVEATEDENGNVNTKANELDQPLPQMESVRDIAYLEPYSESQAEVSEWILDPTNENFGKPKMYTITPVQRSSKGTFAKAVQVKVHPSRVIHITQDNIDDEYFGTPALQNVYNLIYDLVKCTGSNAEIYWLGAYHGLNFDVRDGYELTPEDEEAMEKEIINYTNKLQRFIKTKGITVQPLGSTYTDSSGVINTIMQLIAGAKSIPMRILFGAENGQYAGSVDQDTFFSMISSRRASFAEEGVLKPLIDRLVEAGALPQPKEEEYWFVWPDLVEMAESEKMTSVQTQIQTLSSAQSAIEAKMTSLAEVRIALGMPPVVPSEEALEPQKMKIVIRPKGTKTPEPEATMPPETPTIEEAPINEPTETVPSETP